MNRHPGGVEHTRRMLALARLPEGASVLDLGAGDGETLALYQSLGWFQDAVDLGEDRWAAVNDAPVEPFTLAEYAEYGYTQEQIDEFCRR